MTPDQLKSARLLCEQATCPKCNGEGLRAYGDTTCGRGGAGGQMITTAACRDCRGTGARVEFLQASRTLVPALLDEVERLRAHVADLEANAVRMREYRFALENIPTDGKGNPLPGDTRNP